MARRGAEKLWKLLQTEDYVHTLGAMTGNQAMQQVRAGLKAIYLSGWQVAADSNNANAMYPDQSLYPADSGPALAKRINKTLQRADQIQTMENEGDIDWFAPIVADAEAGFGGVLNAVEIMKTYFVLAITFICQKELNLDTSICFLLSLSHLPNVQQLKNHNLCSFVQFFRLSQFITDLKPLERLYCPQI